jgi:hypothetical protein
MDPSQYGKGLEKHTILLLVKVKGQETLTLI